MAQVLKKLKLNLKGIPESQREIAKEDVTDFILNEIRRHLAKGKSPVEGESFDRLNKDYAKKEKGGNTTPNLQLEGDLISKLEGFSTIGTNQINIGYQEGNPESEKADGHNKFTGRTNNLPKRRFIPTSKQSFNDKIKRGYTKILNSYKSDEFQQDLPEEQTPEARENQPQKTEVDLSGLFENNLERIIRRAEGRSVTPQNNPAQSRSFKSLDRKVESLGRRFDKNPTRENEEALTKAIIDRSKKKEREIQDRIDRLDPTRRLEQALEEKRREIKEAEKKIEESKKRQSELKRRLKEIMKNNK